MVIGTSRGFTTLAPRGNNVSVTLRRRLQNVQHTLHYTVISSNNKKQ